MEQVKFLHSVGDQINIFLSSLTNTKVNILKTKSKIKHSKISKPKIQKDPNRPKKPADVTAVYIKDQKKLRPQQFENLPKKQCTKILSRQWAQVNDTVRDRYTRIYQKEMERYRQHLKKERKERQARQKQEQNKK